MLRIVLPYLANTSTRFCKSWHGDWSWQKEHFKHTVVMGNKVITIYGLLEVLVYNMKYVNIMLHLPCWILLAIFIYDNRKYCYT